MSEPGKSCNFNPEERTLTGPDSGLVGGGRLESHSDEHSKVCRDRHFNQGTLTDSNISVLFDTTGDET